jgi:NADPH-dependent glutamate synthase beta subunit-like oxidoreductase/ferredoxin
MTTQKRLYLPSESVDLNGTTKARLLEKEVYFSTDERDFGWVRENIPCQANCPAITNIPGYIRTIFEGRYGRSYELNRFVNLLPGVLGRICSRPCELECRHGWEGNGAPVAICNLKRAAADLKPVRHRISEELFSGSGKKIAVIGSGPSGLACAHDLAVFGHRVTMFESMSEPGGMLRFAIPDFRLPRALLKSEIDNVLRLGIDLQCGVSVGKDISVKSLAKDYDAVVLAAGTFKPNVPPIPGRELPQVYSGLEFMMKVNSGEKIDVGKNVHVIGGGYTAMDCARTSKRLGARNVTINVLGTEEFLQIEKHELFEVKFERVRLRGLVSIQEINGDDKVESVRYKRNRLGEYLPNGERAGVPIDGSDFEEKVSCVIFATGQQPDPAFIDVGLAKRKNGWIKSPGNDNMTSEKGVFLAGDFMNGASTIIGAIGSGRRTAGYVDQFLTGEQRKMWVVRQEEASILRERKWDFIERQQMPTIKFTKRMKDDGSAEVDIGYDEKTTLKESKRCYLCYLKFEIDTSRCIYCRRCIEVAPKDCIKLAEGVIFNDDGSYAGLKVTNNWDKVKAIAIDNKECIRCGACLTICPVNCINVVKTELVEHAAAAVKED